MSKHEPRRMHQAPQIHETPWHRFPNRPSDESVYRYPHEYKIQFRTHDRFSQQRHVWRWWNGADGVEEVDAWIRTLESPKKIETLPEATDGSATDKEEL